MSYVLTGFVFDDDEKEPTSYYLSEALSHYVEQIYGDYFQDSFSIGT